MFRHRGLLLRVKRSQLRLYLVRTCDTNILLKNSQKIDVFNITLKIVVDLGLAFHQSICHSERGSIDVLRLYLEVLLPQASKISGPAKKASMQASFLT